MRFSFYKHSRLWDRFEKIFGNGFCEVFGTFHPKIYIFDDTVILTGANL